MCIISNPTSYRQKLEEGHYKIFNNAAGSSRLASFETAAPILLVPGSIPAESIVVQSVFRPQCIPSESNAVENHPEAGAAVHHGVVVATNGQGEPWTLRSDNAGGYLIQADITGDTNDWVWHASEENFEERRVYIEPASGVAEQSWTFQRSKYYGS
ncbi:hypothetical protein C8R45DRAFT_926809 [Mycena sanguinolenta]|nr:hypothetical protein C8R45DRAFT_926809 [Mycena sanguinolenta]